MNALDDFMDGATERNPGEPEFHAVKEAHATRGTGRHDVRLGGETVVDMDGIESAKLAFVRELKEVRRGRIVVGLALPAEEVDRRLTQTMADIHRQCVEHSPDADPVDYLTGANRAGFTKVANAMLSFGLV